MGNKSSRANLIVGLALIGLGALFLLQQFFDFNFWDTLWPFLVIAAVGVGLWLHGLRANDPELRRRGRQTLQSGLVMLLIFGAFFELIIFGSARVASWAGPVLLIAVGGYLLLRSALGGGRREARAKEKELGTPPPQGGGALQ